MAGSTRQQTVGRINQVAYRGYGNEDEDKNEDEDEIPSYAVLLTASVKRFSVSRMQDLIKNFTIGILNFFFCFW